MTTKFISAIFLLLLVWATSIDRACICLEEVQDAHAIAAVVIQAVPSDLCPDCGHPRSCCSTHQEFAKATGYSVEISESIQVTTANAFDSLLPFQPWPKKHQHLRAPPFLVQQLTPFSAKQVLLI
jgi:hypothetical protein